MRIRTLAKRSDRWKWNFTMGLLYGIFFNVRMGFSDPNAVLPAFINSLTNSKVLIGLFAPTVETKGSFSQLGSVLLHLFVASKLEIKTHKKTCTGGSHCYPSTVLGRTCLNYLF